MLLSSGQRRTICVDYAPKEKPLDKSLSSLQLFVKMAKAMAEDIHDLKDVLTLLVVDNSEDSSEVATEVVEAQGSVNAPGTGFHL